MKLTRILLLTIVIMIFVLFTIVWFAPDSTEELENEESLIFAGNISDEEKMEWLSVYNEGFSLKDAEDYSAAIEKFEEAIAIDPDNGAAYILL